MVCMFFVRLEDAMTAGALALAHHIDLYARVTEFSPEFVLDKVIELLLDPHWVPTLVKMCISMKKF